MHDPGRPGRQRHLQRRTARAAIVHRLEGRPDHHLRRTDEQDHAPVAGHGRGHRVLRSRGDVHAHDPSSAPPAAPTARPSPRRRGHLHDPGRPGRQRHVQRGTPVPQSFTVTKADQTITFGALPDKTLAQSPVTVTATATSGLAVTFTSTTTVGLHRRAAPTARRHLGRAGTCTIQADQAGNGTYNAAPPVARSFNVTNVVIPPPVVTAINPTSGPVTGATSVTITGTDLNGATPCFGATPAASFTVNRDLDHRGRARPRRRHRSTSPSPPPAGPVTPARPTFTFVKLNQTITFGASANKTMLQSPVTVAATASSASRYVHVDHTVGVHGGRHQRHDDHARRRGYLHDPGRPGRQRHLQRRTAGAADFTVSKADQTITFGALAEQDHAPVAGHGRRHRVVGARGDVHVARRPSCARPAAPTARRHAHRRGHVHDPGRPGGQRHLQRRTRRAADRSLSARPTRRSPSVPSPTRPSPNRR